MDNANIHHSNEITDLIETQAGAKVCYLLPSYFPDLNPLLRGFSAKPKILNDKLIQATIHPELCLLGHMPYFLTVISFCLQSLNEVPNLVYSFDLILLCQNQ